MVGGAESTRLARAEDVYRELLIVVPSHYQGFSKIHTERLACSIKILAHINAIENHSGLSSHFYNFRPVLKRTHVMSFNLHIGVNHVVFKERIFGGVHFVLAHLVGVEKDLSV